MMKTMWRVALMMGLAAMSTTSVDAAQIHGPGDEDTTEIYVMNNHLSDVRVFLEDTEGTLHKLGRISRGKIGSFMIPEALSGEDVRIKVFPTSPVWSPLSDDRGIKTIPLNASRDHQVRLWLEADLTRSILEVAKG